MNQTSILPCQLTSSLCMSFSKDALESFIGLALLEIYWHVMVLCSLKQLKSPHQGHCIILRSSRPIHVLVETTFGSDSDALLILADTLH
jgi:hypothetical protein